ncbi:hypothetical protein AAHE18_03G235400 [Arachis hypogaea]
MKSIGTFLLNFTVNTLLSLASVNFLGNAGPPLYLDHGKQKSITYSTNHEIKR